MSAIRWCSVAVLMCGALAACDAIFGKELNPKFCAAHPDDRECLDDASQSCSSSAECTAPLVCDVGGTNTCVECTQQEDASCMGATPVCGDHACRGCVAHAECPDSDACLPDGSCADPGQVAYVQQGGMGIPPCARGTPCGTLQQGVDSSRPYIKITAGMLVDTDVTTIDAKAVKILAAPGAKLDRTGDGPVLLVRSAGANVSIYDLEITGQTGPADGAIQLEPNGGTPALSLVRVKITGGQGRGISATGGTLTVTQSTISGNTGGGISISNAEFDLTNNFIVGNGGTGTVFGGIRFDQTNTGMRRFEFNTVTNNIGMAGFSIGVVCTLVGQPITFSSNIVYDNQVGGGRTQVGGMNCSWTYSDIGPDTVTGMGNINMNPMFRDPTQSDFHLQSGSPAKDAADPATSLEVDIDGDPRPQGTARDMGADEIR